MTDRANTRRRRWLIGLLLALAVATMLAACAPASSADSTRNPFRSRWEAQESLSAVFEGLAQGHSRGGVSTFRLQLTNRSPEDLDTGYCVLLIGGGFTNQLLFEERSLSSESSVSVEIVVVIPPEITPGAYELGLLLIDRGDLGTTVYVETEVGSPVPALTAQPAACARPEPGTGAP